MLGPFDAATFMNSIRQIFQVTIVNIATQLTSFNFIAFFGIFLAIGKIIWNFIILCIATATWFLLAFIPWLIWDPWPPTLFNMNKYDTYIDSAFLPWTIRIFMVIADKIGNFPKCFIWYLLDIVGWTIYLPFRFLFWLLDSMLNTKLVEGERYVWHILNDVDYYIHGPIKNYFLDQYVTMFVGANQYKSGIKSKSPKPDSERYRKDGTLGIKVPRVLFDDFVYTGVNQQEERIDVKGEEATIKDKDSLNTGFHIIHFPDMVMETCYGATGYRLASLKPYPIECFTTFMKSLKNPFFF